MRTLWIVAHDIYWRCRWGTSIELPEGYKEAHAACEAAMYGPQSGRQL